MSREIGITRRAAIASGAITVGSAVAGCTGAFGIGQQPLETTFDEGNEGWSAVDLVSHEAGDPDWSTVQQELEVRHVQNGGVDDSGYIMRTDTTGDAFFFDASDTYTGEKSAYAGGTLEFYLTSSHNNWRRDSGVILAGTDGIVTTEFARPETDWTRFRIELDAEVRTYHESNLNGPEVGQERIEEVLSNLQALRISGEHGASVEEEVGLDEVRLLEA